MEQDLKELQGKRRLFSALRYISLAALAAAVALSIIFKNSGALMSIFIIAALALAFVFFRLCSVCSAYKQKIYCIRIQNGDFTHDKILQQIAISYYSDESADEHNGIEFSVSIFNDGEFSCYGFLFGDKPCVDMDVEFFEGKMCVSISSADGGANSAIEKEFEYKEASPDLSLSDITRFLKAYYDGYNLRSVGVISSEWISKVLDPAVEGKALKKNKITGRNGSIFNACSLFGTTYIFGRDAAAAYDKIENKNGFVFTSDSKVFADEITEADTSAALLKKGKFLAVDKDYKWSYISDGKTAHFITDVYLLHSLKGKAQR